MILFDLDPNVVKPGWTPLIITILIAAALVLLYLSMRRQFRKIDVNRFSGEESDQVPTEPSAADPSL
jgi:hypothetical protein